MLLQKNQSGILGFFVDSLGFLENGVFLMRIWVILEFQVFRPLK